MVVALPQALDALAKATQELAQKIAAPRPDSATRLFTEVMSVATVVLALVGLYQAYLTRRAVKSASDSAKATQKMASLARQQLLALMAADAPMVALKYDYTGETRAIWRITLTNGSDGDACRPRLFAYHWWKDKPWPAEAVATLPLVIHKGSACEARCYPSPDGFHVPNHHAATLAAQPVLIICHYVDKHHSGDAPRVYHSTLDKRTLTTEAVEGYYGPERLPEEYQALCTACQSVTQP